MYDHIIIIILLAITVLVLAFYADHLHKKNRRHFTHLASVMVQNIDLTVEKFELERKVHDQAEAIEILTLLASNNFVATIIPLVNKDEPVDEWQRHVDEALAVGNE